MNTNRREFMFGAAATVAASATPAVVRAAGAPMFPSSVKPLPLAVVRLTPSDYATAVEVNRTYLLSLSADRFLHNFMRYAGLPPKGEIYGGWESDTIAGHTLGHYLSALVCTYQQTGDKTCQERADYIVAELARAGRTRHRLRRRIGPEAQRRQDRGRRRNFPRSHARRDSFGWL
jgi:DUF1680 family protein